MKQRFLLLLLSFFAIHFAFSQWNTNGNNIYNSNTGFVGIGTSTPTTQLHVIYTSNLTTPSTGSWFVTNHSTTNTGSVINLGSSFKATHASGDVIQAISVSGVCENNGTGNVVHLKGIQGIAWISGSGTATNGYGLVGGISVTGSGSVTNGYGVYVAAFPNNVTNKGGCM